MGQGNPQAAANAQQQQRMVRPVMTSNNIPNNNLRHLLSQVIYL